MSKKTKRLEYTLNLQDCAIRGDWTPEALELLDFTDLNVQAKIAIAAFQAGKLVPHRVLKNFATEAALVANNFAKYNREFETKPFSAIFAAGALGMLPESCYPHILGSVNFTIALLDAGIEAKSSPQINQSCFTKNLEGIPKQQWIVHKTQLTRTLDYLLQTEAKLHLKDDARVRTALHIKQCENILRQICIWQIEAARTATRRSIGASAGT